MLPRLHVIHLFKQPVLNRAVSSVASRTRPSCVTHEGVFTSKIIHKPCTAGPLNIDITTRNYAITRNYKQDLPFIVEVPPKIPFVLDSGDPDLPKIDMSQPIPEVKDSKELETADEVTKKLVSLELGNRRHKVAVIQREYIEKVQRHKYDFDSLEVKVAILTAKIRNLLELVKEDWRDSRRRVILMEMIQHRTKHLKMLRKLEYRRFAFVVEALDLEYRAPPCFPWKMTYKRRFQILTTDLCRRIREERVLAYRDHLRSQQAAFLKQKEDTLSWIADQEKKFDLKPEETDVEPKPTNWYQFIPPRYKHPDMPPPKVTPSPLE